MNYWVSPRRSFILVRTAHSDFFRVDLAKKKIQWHPAGRGSPFDSSRRKFCIRLLELFVSHLTPSLLLHASAVALGEGGGCFLGASGQGKSTLGAALAARGFPLVNDDVAVVQKNGKGFYLQPGFPGISTDSSPSPSFKSKPVVLRSLYILCRGRHRSIKLEPIRGQELLVTLTRNTPHLIVQSPEILRQNFQLTAELLRRVPVKRLIYPSGLAHLPSVCDAVLQDLRG